MLQTVFAIAVASLIFAAMSGTAQAAPVAPLHVGVAADLSFLTDVQWRRCWRAPVISSPDGAQNVSTPMSTLGH